MWRMNSRACTRKAMQLVLKMARLWRMDLRCSRWKLASQATAGLSLLRVNICMPGEVALPATHQPTGDQQDISFPASVSLLGVGNCARGEVAWPAMHPCNQLLRKAT